MKKFTSISVLATPEPTWFHKSPQKSSWASWLIQSNHYGSITEIGPKQMIDASAGDFFIVLQGCVTVSGIAPDRQKSVFVDALRSGDIIWSLNQNSVVFEYETRTMTVLLKVPKRMHAEFNTGISYYETVLMAGELDLMTKHSLATQYHFANPVDRVSRVINILVQHPEALSGPRGIEVHASKEDIRHLAGLERRLSTQAFKTLEGDGTVNFNGYKTFFYREPVQAQANA